MAPEPITMFNLVPDLPGETLDVYPEQSVHLQGNGFAILRNGTSDERRYLYLDYGIMGGEHGHPDRLQMGYYADGRNWVVDPLNESYMNPNLQLWYRQSIAHNTLVVDQTSQTWTNGYGNFYGALPALQVASGGSTSAYPGVALTRTLIQVGDYFIDLFDAEAPEKRIFDLPLHSFGALTVGSNWRHNLMTCLVSGLVFQDMINSPEYPPGIPTAPGAASSLTKGSTSRSSCWGNRVPGSSRL